MPATLRSPDLGAVWLIQSRKLISELEFWLILIGYDRKTHSFGSRIYLVYVIVFFSIWIFAVLTLLAGVAGQVLDVLPFGSPLFAAAAVGGAAVIAVFLLDLYSASRRSPFVFSEADATLLCMAPVDRRFVALIWLLSHWAVQALLFGAGAIVLGYGLLEAQSAGTLGIEDLPRYILAGLRMLVVFLPLHLAAQASAWAVGAWRLSRKRFHPTLRWIAPLLASGFVAAWILSSLASRAALPGWLWGMVYPVRAGLGAASLPAGIGLALLLAAAGMFALWSASPGMSLARAAQETRGREALQTSAIFEASDLAQDLKRRERLGASRKPSRLPAYPGLGALPWKNAVQESRSFSIGQLASWAAILGLGLAASLASDWGARAWLIVAWIVFAGGRSVASLRRDLGRWWLLHQLPYSSEQIVLLELGLPLLGVALTGAATLVLLSQMGVAVPTAAVWLYFPGAVGIALATAVDVLRQCRVSRLLAGSAPDQSLLSVLLGVLYLGLLGAAAWWLQARLSLSPWLAIPVLLVICAGIDYGLYCWAGSLLRRVR